VRSELVNARYSTKKWLKQRTMIVGGLKRDIRSMTDMLLESGTSNI
jgi:hypothetical protein